MTCTFHANPIVVSALLCTLVICSGWLPAQNPQASSVSHEPRIEAKDYEQFAPYWTAESGWRTELQMRNNRAQGDLTVTPVLRSESGSEFPLAPVVIAPNEIKSVDVSQAITTQAPELAGGYGSVVFRYHTGSMRNLYAAVMVYDEGHPIVFHFDTFVEATDFDAGTREGVWWLPSATARDYLILTNNHRGPLATTLRLFDANGKSWSQRIIFSAKSTNRYSVRDLLRKAGLAGSYGGFKIEVKSKVGSLDTAHLLFDEIAGFSALMKTFDRDPQGKIAQRVGFPAVTQWTTRAPMLALTNPDPALGFPSGTTLQPQLLVRNTTATPATVSTRFNWRGDAGTGSSSGPNLRLAANETRSVDVAALQKNGTIPADAHWASVEIAIAGQPNDIMAVAASFDSTLRYGTQTPFNDQLTYRWEGGEWRVDPTHNSIITATNGGTVPIKAQITIYYDAGGKRYDLEQPLKPHEQMWVDVGKLIHEGTPDKNGSVLPSDLTMGAYEIQDLTDHGVGNLYEGKLTVDKTYGHAAYGCATCCGYMPGPYMYWDPIGVGSGATNNQDVWDHDNCTGVDTSVLDYFPPISWGTGNHAIATANGHVITGVAPGSTTNFASGTLTTGNVESHYCPRQQFNPSGNVNSQPTITAINPAQGLVGTAVNVTITGTGFAQGATIQAGTSITVSNVSVSSSTSITATFTIENSADAGGNWNVTVTSNGQTSNSKPFFVQIPTSLNVISVNLIANGANGGCKSTDYGIHVDVKYQVQDQNTHAIQSAAMIPQESVNGSGWGDVGPNAVMTTAYTNSDGTYDDAPLGTCASASFNMTVTQAVRMDVNGGYYNVRTNSFTVIGSSAGHGSISNGSDINKTR